MTRKVAFLSTIILTAGIAAASIGPASKTDFAEGEKGAVSFSRKEMNGTVIGAIRAFGGNNSATHVLVEGEELDVHAITIQNGFSSNGLSQRILVAIIIDGFPYYVTMDGFRTEHITFPIPLPLRAGDTIAVTTPEASGNNHYTSLQLIGRTVQAEGFELR